jgi:transglutaminase-like putative cysteine protease
LPKTTASARRSPSSIWLDQENRSMRIKVRHETAYAYKQQVRSAVQLLRMTPRSCDNQFVRRWRVEVDTDARLDKSEDAYGNITHTVFIDQPVDHVRIMIEGEVDTIDTGGVLAGTYERQPVRLYLRETALTMPADAVKQLAREAAADTSGDMIASLHNLNLAIHSTMTFTIGTTTATTTAGEALALKTGICQDYAHIFVSAARSLGVPARYVSGYYLRTDVIDQDAGHAWAEAWLDRLGWVGFDPAQGACVNDRYVRVAVGSDSNEAAPVRGARTGGASEALSVAIQVSQGRAIVEN